nr:MAG TPA: protein of unknown function (DUF4314) [Herelleviridae sp.]
MYEQYTDKQIVEMLEPKLAKLGWRPEFGPRTEKLISTLYKSGYIRGQLGRSFIIGQPKQTKHWVPTTRDNVKVGSKVRYLNAEKHLKNPEFYPAQGTIGKVVSVSNDSTRLVQWPGYPVPCFANRSDLEVLVDGLDEVEPTKAKKWVPATKDNVKVGSKVRMIDREGHKRDPERIPDVGTVGTVMKVGFNSHFVQWPEGSTSEADMWYCNEIRLEVLLCE